MTERSEYVSGNSAVPVIPYDTFEAANLFLATGKTRDEVLPRIGLNAAEWERLREAYRWFPYSYGDTSRHTYFNGLNDAEIYRLVLPPRWLVKEGDQHDLRSTWHVREAVRLNPYIGPFKNCGWPYAFIAAHAEATLCCYTHDRETVYFDGRPLVDREGKPIALDAVSFKAIGGRWLHDKHHVYGQGEYGAKRTAYWYIVENADVATFQALNLRYARDKNQAYYITGKTIRTKSPETFEVVPELRLNYRDGTCEPMHEESILARDRDAVYFYGARLKNAKPAEFRDLGHGYATDGTTVWFLDQKQEIEGADAESFLVPGPGEPPVQGRGSSNRATDRHRPYIDGKPCDPHEHFDEWSAFFRAKPHLHGWWWHTLAS